MDVTVGIDVSKLTLDAAILKEGCISVKNNPAGHAALLAKVQKLAPGAEVRFCMEATGCYYFGLALFLADSGLLVSVENPRRVKHFGIATGAVQKTDKADSKVIARYCRDLAPPAWKLSSPQIRELMLLDRRYNDVLGMRNQEAE